MFRLSRSGPKYSRAAIGLCSRPASPPICRLFETQRANDYAVLNADDAHCVAYSAITRARPVWFSSTRAITPGVWLENGSLWFDGEVLMPAREIPIRGLHNVENTMAAAAVA